MDNSSLRKAVKDTSCGRSAGVLFFAILLLMLVILGNAINTGSESTAWGLYVCVIIIGLAMLVVLFVGTGTDSAGTPFLFSLLAVFMSILGILALVMAKPKMETKDLAVAYISVILPGLCGLIYSPVYKILKGKFTKTSSKTRI